MANKIVPEKRLSTAMPKALLDEAATRQKKNQK